METNNTLSDDENRLEKAIEAAIESELGDVDALPPEVFTRVRAIYRKFMPAYIEMMRLQKNHPKGWRPDSVDIDPDLVEDLLHFFSDYQHVAREFKQINRQVRQLLKLNPEKEARQYGETVDKIVSGREETPILASLVGH